MAKRLAAGAARRVRAGVAGSTTAASAAATTAASPGRPAGTESAERRARRVEAIGHLLAAKPPGAR